MFHSTELSDLPVAHTLWVGPSLPPMAQACLRSLHRVGHQVVLHTYGPVANVPTGVEIADAAQTIPQSGIIRHRRTGSLALFSDLFRFRLLQAGADMWVDCDVYALKPIPRQDYLFGWEHDRSINCCVLALPKDSELLKTLIAFAENPGVPPWFNGPRKWLTQLLQRLGVVRGAEDLPWGSIGPAALTYFARQFGKTDLALPTDVLSPLAHYRVGKLFNPRLSLRDIVTDRTICVHLYSSIVGRRRGHVPPTSPLGQLLES